MKKELKEVLKNGYSIKKASPIKKATAVLLAGSMATLTGCFFDDDDYVYDSESSIESSVVDTTDEVVNTDPVNTDVFDSGLETEPYYECSDVVYTDSIVESTELFTSTTSPYETTSISSELSTTDTTVATTVNTVSTSNTTTTNTSVYTTNTSNTTANATTTTTETTTVPIETKPIETQPNELKYDLNEICYDPNAFNYYVEEMKKDVFGAAMTYGDVYSWNGIRYRTDFTLECAGALALFNNGMINDEVLTTCLHSDQYGDNYKSVLKNGSAFISYMFSCEDEFETKIDFSKYTLDKDYGAYFNQINEASFDAMNGNQDKLKEYVDDYFKTCSNDYNWRTCNDQVLGLFLASNCSFIIDNFVERYVTMNFISRCVLDYIDTNYSYTRNKDSLR